MNTEPTYVYLFVVQLVAIIDILLPMETINAQLFHVVASVTNEILKYIDNIGVAGGFKFYVNSKLRDQNISYMYCRL